MANSRGIPSAEFVENVEAFLAKSGKTFEQVIGEQQVMYSKYKFMESQLTTQKRGIMRKIPDIKNALAAVEALIARKEEGENYQTEFQLADAVFAKAEVSEENNTVFIWLGANIMLEYEYDEARDLLGRNLVNAEEQLVTLTTDLDFLKDQITTSEVCLARFHNHGVKLRKELQAAAAASSGKK